MKFTAINKNKNFIRAYRKGKSFIGSTVITYVIKNRYGYTRIGITSSKKIGCAVKRNRSRRVIRAAVRSLNLDMNQGYDIIFVARSRTAKAKSYEVASLIEKQLKEAGVIHAEEDTNLSNQSI